MLAGGGPLLDELLNANKVILNSLLLALNERLLGRGKESRRIKALMFVGASNIHLPEDDALEGPLRSFPAARALRQCRPRSNFLAVLDAGWKLQHPEARAAASLHFDAIRAAPAFAAGGRSERMPGPTSSWCSVFAMRASPFRIGVR